jgi:hypothetical protein
MAMPEVRIYQPAKTAMQSGRGNTHYWVLEYEPSAPKAPDPLMGWIGSPDTNGQIHLRFATKEEAIAFAKKNGLPYRVFEPRERHIRPKSYAENFSFTRVHG